MKSPTSYFLASHRLCLFMLATCLTLTLTSGAKAQSGITYVYDELGRLIAVTDPAGDTVRYTYDAVGNVLSISRHSSSTLSIVNFNPKSGPVGTSVTIYGTAFSTNPSQNTVTFNGVTASVVSETATQIVTTVPTGATTGLINVTTSAGSVSSSTSFTVSASNAPTISNFTPTIGAPGTSVTVSGTNFETTASKNKTKFNITHAVVSSASATSISTSVPLISGSGKVAVSTPNGAAVSTDDFFVPPSPYTASDVAVTGRMTSGGSQTVNISTANKIGMFLFEASAGQRAAVKVTSSAITSTNVSILNPNGSVALLGTIGTYGGIVDTPSFTSSGTHTIVVDPNASYTGSLTFTLYVFNDVIDSITPGGSAVTVTTTIPGQNGRLAFSGTANQRVSLKVTSINLTGGINNWVNVSIKKPDGSTLVSSTYLGGDAFLDVQILPVTGTYTILVDPWDTSIGSATLTLYAVPADVTGTITAGGAASTVTTTTPGQNAILTFSGTAGQRVSLQLSNSTFAGCLAVYDIIKNPDGTNLAWTYLCSATGYIDTVVLPVTGSYTIQIDPQGTTTGSQTLLLNDVPADVAGTITAGGAAVTVTTTTAGQNAILTFSGTAGQRVSLQLSNSTFSGCLAVYDIIKNPDGTNLSWTYLCGATGYIDTLVLPVTGSYTILIDPQGTTTGSQTLLLNDVADVTGTITPGGSAVTVTTTVAGQNGQLNFSGSANQRVSLQVSGVNLTGGTLNVANVSIKKPDGSTLISFLVSGNEFFDTQVLPVAGTYVILVDPWDTVTGSLTLTLYDVPADATSTATVGGPAVTVTTTVPGQNAKVTFSGTAAQQIAVNFTNNSMGTVTAKLFKPDGSQLTSITSNSSSFNLAVQTLPETGTYTVGMDSSGAATGSLTVTIQDVAANLAFNKTATQSSTNWGAPADRAVDGNTDGNFGNNSVLTQRSRARRGGTLISEVCSQSATSTCGIAPIAVEVP